MERPPYESPFPKESGIVQRMRSRVGMLPFHRPRVLVACSGGKDSVALAAVCAELQRLGLIHVRLAHVHHGQHSHADAAAEAVDEIGHRLGLPVSGVRLEQERIDTHSGVGIEEALRRERYLALATIASSTNADVIATGHHQQDQAETILLRLIRGTGSDGLCGMRELSTMNVPWWDNRQPVDSLTIWRPLLPEPQHLLETIALRSGLPIVDDPSNAESEYRRNAIRHQVLPVLEEIAEGATASIARSAEVIATDLDALQAAEELVLNQIRRGDRLDADSVRELLPALQQRVIRRWLIESGIGTNLSAERVRSVMDLIQRNRSGATVQLPAGAEVFLQQGEIRFRKT